MEQKWNKRGLKVSMRQAKRKCGGFFPELWKLKCKVEKACKMSEKILLFSVVDMRKDCDLKEMGRKKPE